MGMPNGPAAYWGTSGHMIAETFRQVRNKVTSVFGTTKDEIAISSSRRRPMFVVARTPATLVSMGMGKVRRYQGGTTFQL